MKPIIFHIECNVGGFSLCVPLHLVYYFRSTLIPFQGTERKNIKKFFFTIWSNILLWTRNSFQESPVCRTFNFTALSRCKNRAADFQIKKYFLSLGWRHCYLTSLFTQLISLQQPCFHYHLLLYFYIFNFLEFKFSL